MQGKKSLWLLGLPVIVGLLAYFGFVLLTGGGVEKLSSEELRGMLAGNEEFFFLDVREPDELEKLGTIPGYVNIPLGQLESRLNEIPRDVRIVSACERARRAAKAADILARHGYDQISLCALTEWREKGFDVVYPEPDAEQ